MKVIRKLKPVSVFSDKALDREQELTVQDLDSDFKNQCFANAGMIHTPPLSISQALLGFREHGYFDHIIRPMLNKGHEGELVSWLKMSGLIPQFQKCKNSDENENCKKPLSWYSARTMDHYQWKCLNCSRRYSIRENSLFNDFKCNMKDALRLILAWCKGTDVETICSALGVKKQVVNGVFRNCTIVAEKYIKNNLRHWHLGGPNTIVIVDIFPEVYNKYTSEDQIKNSRNISPIICIAEAKENPPRYWFEMLNRNTKKEQQCARALDIIEKVVKPGSIIVSNLNSSLCSFYALQGLKHLYPIIVSVDSLERHNTVDQNVLNNLKEIWKDAISICDYAQSNIQNEVHSSLINFMWSRKFGTEAFEVLLNQMSCTNSY